MGALAIAAAKAHEARNAALKWSLLGLAVLVGVRWHWDNGDDWTTPAGLAGQTLISLALVAVATRVRAAFAACVLVWQPVSFAGVAFCGEWMERPTPFVRWAYLPIQRDCALDVGRRLMVCGLSQVPMPFSCLGRPNYIRELEIGEGIAAWLRATLNPPLPLEIPPSATLNALAASKDTGALTSEDWDDIRFRQKIEGRQAEDPGAVAALAWSDGEVLIARFDGEVELCHRPPLACYLTWTRADGAWGEPTPLF